MLEAVKVTILKNNLLENGDNILLALSGGADSVALLHALLQLRGELDIDINAVHINHKMRGADSDNDEAFVRELCQSLKIPLKIYTAEEAPKTEEAARDMRYRFFSQAAAHFNTQKTATAHNQNDNAETILLNLCRGTGLRGLCGIPVKNGDIIRPLLETPRSEIENFLHQNNIQYVTDDTNRQNIYTRNRIRNTVLPLLQESINPAAIQSITRAAAQLTQDAAYLEEQAINAYNANKSLNIKTLTALPTPILSRVLRHAIAEAGQKTDITAAHIQAAIDLLHNQSGRRIHLPNITIAREYDNLIINTPAPPPQKTIYCTKSFSYDKILENVQIRKWQNGDKITFKAKDGTFFTKKIKNYFADEKIPKSVRGTITLVAIGDTNEILWILDEKNRINAKYTPIEGEKTIEITVRSEQ